MTTWLLLITSVFRFSNDSINFDQYILKGYAAKQHVRFQFQYQNLDDFDVLVVERFDTTQKIFVKVMDLTTKDIAASGNHTFEFVLPIANHKKSLSDMVQLKLITKNHFIKIYNDINVDNIFFTNSEKKLYSFGKKNNGLLQLNIAQKKL